MLFMNENAVSFNNTLMIPNLWNTNWILQQIKQSLRSFYIMANAESISAALLSMYRSASGTFTILVLEVLKWRQPLRRNKAEQYRHAGITFEGIELPTKIAKETIAAAEKAAAANGYDNFGEKHNALASKFHFAIKRKIYPNICTCNSCALNVKY